MPASVPVSPPAAAATPTPMRYSSRPVMWGSKQRFETVDNSTGKVIAIWGNQGTADNVVTWWNLRDMQMRRAAAKTAPPVQNSGPALA